MTTTAGRGGARASAACAFGREVGRRTEQHPRVGQGRAEVPVGWLFFRLSALLGLGFEMTDATIT